MRNLGRGGDRGLTGRGIDVVGAETGVVRDFEGNGTDGGEAERGAGRETGG